MQNNAFFAHGLAYIARASALHTRILYKILVCCRLPLWVLPHLPMQECASEYNTITPIVGGYCVGLLVLAMFLVYSMRHRRHQFNEYNSVRRVAVAIVLAPVLFLSINAVTGPEHGKLRRRTEFILSVIITAILFWTPVYQAVWAFIVKDEVSAVAICSVLDVLSCNSLGTGAQGTILWPHL